jgi:hypothetical protein
MSHREARNLLTDGVNLNQMERGLDEQLNTQFANETSRTVKICMLKHKCILMFSFMLISLLQFVYIALTALMDDKQLTETIIKLVSIYSKTANVTEINDH